MTDLPQPLAVRTLGEGNRKILALHCTIGHSGAWRPLSACLPDCVFTAPDMLSHGKSPDWDRQGDFQDRMTEAVLPYLTERMDVIGHSFGGTVALRLAVEHPDLVRSLTVVEPVLFAVAEHDAPEVLEDQNRASKPVFDAFEQGDEVLAARLFNRMWGDNDGPRWDEMPDKTRNAMIRGIHIVQASNGAVKDRVGLLKPDRIERANMPALVLRGALSPTIATVVNDGLAKRLPNAENVEVAGAGHMVPLTHPQETAAQLRRLFDRASV
ncbi:MAG: alpha/beta fold hydrolase [Paracoccaceae bacterium]